ncbi:DUF3265 domain-containing protein [Vibrio vulnificus]|nr:DUF3265 domain-containing protein [Vibrio vulnificus]EGQ9971747.1 DUF3265 domain-containing protein [Vibrio vulnificus]EIJ0943857.1 DUF3265 domain-containing protein [Vibrio vulnificus]
MTRRLRGIHAAWHFWFAVSVGGESGLRQLGLCGIHPLTQRYVLGGKIRLWILRKSTVECALKYIK